MDEDGGPTAPGRGGASTSSHTDAYAVVQIELEWYPPSLPGDETPLTPDCHGRVSQRPRMACHHGGTALSALNRSRLSSIVRQRRKEPTVFFTVL